VERQGAGLNHVSAPGARRLCGSPWEYTVAASVFPSTAIDDDPCRGSNLRRMSEFETMTAATTNSPIGNLEKDQSTSTEREPFDHFADWFSRCRNTLHYMADLILSNPELAEHAVQNCRQKASQNLPVFESEAEFRGWIFRLLINEALRISFGGY
jgi:hypothetical protein